MESKFIKLLKEFFEPAEDGRSSLMPYILFSIFLHLLIFIVSPWMLQSFSDDIEEELVEVIPLQEMGEEYRIADIAEPLNQQKPNKTNLLGRYNSTVKKETVSSRKSKQAKRQIKKQDSQKKYSFDKKAFSSKLEKEIGIGKGNNSGGINDYFPDYQRGQHTYLNVLRYPDVEYFVRLKRAFRITFNPNPALRQHFRSNQVARGSVEVVLAVSVDSKGELAELFILRSSGIKTYDQEGLRTVRASSPFAKPPQKFLDDDGALRMSWTFTVYL